MRIKIIAFLILAAGATGFCFAQSIPSGENGSSVGGESVPLVSGNNDRNDSSEADAADAKDAQDAQDAQDNETSNSSNEDDDSNTSLTNSINENTL